MFQLAQDQLTSSQAAEPDPVYAEFRDQTRFWIQRVAVPVLMVIGLFGNLVTIIIMTRRRMRSTTNMYLAALAFVDMLYLILTFLLGLSHYPNMASRKFHAYWQSKPYLMMLTDACSNTSVWLTVTFTIERFIAVQYPMKGKIWCTEARAKRLIVAIFVVALLFASPVPFEWKVVEKRVPRLPGAAVNSAGQTGGPQSISNGSVMAQMTSSVAPEASPPMIVAVDGEIISAGQPINAPKLDDWEPSNSVTSPSDTEWDYMLALDYSDLGRNDTYKTSYYWSTAVLYYFSPMLLLVVFNGCLIQSVHHSKRARFKLRESAATSTAAATANSAPSQSSATRPNNRGGWRAGKSTQSLDLERPTVAPNPGYNSTITSNDAAAQTKRRHSGHNQFASSRVRSNRPLEPESKANNRNNNSPKAFMSTWRPGSGVPTSDCILEEILPHGPGSFASDFNTTSGQVNLQNMTIKERAKPPTPPLAGGGFATPHLRNGELKVQTSCDNSLSEDGGGFRSIVKVSNDLCAVDIQLDTRDQVSGKCRPAIGSPGGSVRKLPSRYKLLGRKNTPTCGQLPLEPKPPQAVATASSQERRITIMLIAVVILFLICQFPSAGMLLYTSVREIQPNTKEHALVLAFGNIFNFLTAVNAASNFILYSFLSKKYRRTFVSLFCACFRPKAKRGLVQRGQTTRGRLSSSRFDSVSQATRRPTVKRTLTGLTR